MATTEERTKILEMIRDGRITADEGARLLKALQTDGLKADGNARAPRWLRVRVTDTDTGKPKVNVNLPMGLVNVGVRLGARFTASGDSQFDATAALEAIRSGKMGKIVDLVEHGEHIELWVE